MGARAGSPLLAGTAPRRGRWGAALLLLAGAASLLGGLPGRPGPAVDLVVRGGRVVTMDEQDRIIEDGYLVVDKGRIRAVGAISPELELPLAREVIEARGRWVTPGLINTHTHTGHALFRGLVEVQPLAPWTEQAYGAESLVIEPRAVAVATRLAVAEMLKSGTTTFNDHYYHADTVAEVARAAGMRAVVAEPILRQGGPPQRSMSQALEETERLIRRWRGDPLIRVAVGPHHPISCPPEVLRAARALADRHGCLLHFHLAEGEGDAGDPRAGPELLEALGLLGPRAVAAHCVRLGEADQARMIRLGVGISYNPGSNMKLGDGIAPISSLWRAGASLGLGTDGPASNNTLDLFEVMDLGARLQRLVATEARPAPSARDLFWMATRGGARLLDADRELGSLEVGKRADLIVIAADQPHLTPVHDLFAQLVFSARGADVEDVVIEGRLVMKGRALLTLDEGAVLAEARSLALHIRERLREHPDTASLVLGASRPGVIEGSSRSRPGGAR